LQRQFRTSAGVLHVGLFRASWSNTEPLGFFLVTDF
jgi:hypothetical protein